MQHIIGIRTETRRRINIVYCSRNIYLSVHLYLIKDLFVLVKDGTSLRQVNIFGPIFGLLFFLPIRKLILGSKTFDKVWECSHAQ